MKTAAQATVIQTIKGSMEVRWRRSAAALRVASSGAVARSWLARRRAWAKSPDSKATWAASKDIGLNL